LEVPVAKTKIVVIAAATLLTVLLIASIAYFSYLSGWRNAYIASKNSEFDRMYITAANFVYISEPGNGESCSKVAMNLAQGEIEKMRFLDDFLNPASIKRLGVMDMPPLMDVIKGSFESGQRRQQQIEQIDKKLAPVRRASANN
jgi:hypothetical protein